jgi:hypothetical protein
MEALARYLRPPPPPVTTTPTPPSPPLQPLPPPFLPQSVMEEAFIDIDHRALSDQRCEIPTRSGRHQGAIRGNHRAIVGNQLQSEAIRGRFVT